MRRAFQTSPAAWPALALFLGGCPSSSVTSSQDAGMDVPAAIDRAQDLGVTDRPTTDLPRPIDVVDVVDVVRAVDAADVVDAIDVVGAVVDVVDAGRDAGRCDPAAGCRAFWCGCGRCDPAAITCVPDERACPLDCVSACPELERAVCACSGGACGNPTFTAPDAGADASADGGGLAAGEPCTGDAACASGLLCCYPCGIPGCINRCGVPDSRTGRCPLLP